MTKNYLQRILQEKQNIVLGVLNITPDSFSDGGNFVDTHKAIERAEQMIQEGADMIDIGAESSAPNSKTVSEEEEWKRLRNILPALQKANIPFSVDTYKSTIARKALELGACMINDITALRGDAHMTETLSEFPQSHICLMYSKDSSARTTFEDNSEEDIVQTILAFFEERIAFATAQGIEKGRIILDPGMGAFLSSDPNKSFEVIRRLHEFQEFGCPILIGTSRKSFLRQISDLGNPKNRTIASVVSSLIALQNGARIVRVHDVREMNEAIQTWQHTTQEKP